MASSNRENLTPERIRGYVCPEGKGQTFFWDEKTPSLGIRVTAAGAKSFVFEAKLNRETIRITIGNAKTWPLESVWSGRGADRQELQRGAREEANRLQSLIDQGIDPRTDRAEKLAEQKARTEEAKRAEVTVADAWSAYIAARAPKWGTKHQEHHKAFMTEGGQPRTRGRRPDEPATTQPGILCQFLPLRLSEVTAERVRDWLEREAHRPTLAHQACRALRTFLRWCDEQPEYRGLIHQDAYGSRVARDVLPKARAKDDCLQREQLAAWFAEVRKIRNPVIRAYLQILLLTGARREEIAAMRWDDVDFKWGSLTIRDKVEGQRVIPLTPYVASLLADLKQRNEEGPQVAPLKPGTRTAASAKHEPSPWVFSSPASRTGRLQEPRIPHNKATAAAGLPHLSIHGLRRSFGTLCEWVEMPSGISAQIMGHKPSALAEKHYRRRPLDLLRLWHTKIEAWMLEQAGIEQPKEAAVGLRVVNGDMG